MRGWGQAGCLGPGHGGDRENSSVECVCLGFKNELEATGGPIPGPFQEQGSARLQDLELMQSQPEPERGPACDLGFLPPGRPPAPAPPLCCAVRPAVPSLGLTFQPGSL